MKLFFFSIIYYSLFIKVAMAYIGPGAGVGVFATVIGIIVALFLTLFGFVYYPLKRLLIKKQKKKIVDDK